MPASETKPVVIAGGGPAGSVAALCLRKLGRDVVVFEKEKFPRYHIGESLLPGTLAILTRLGVIDRVKAANFTKKPGATFVWGHDRAPWTFTFSTPKTASWVFDHAYQVNRPEYDKILLDAARDHGATVNECHEVVDIDAGSNGDSARVSWKNSTAHGAVDAAFAIDGSGAAGLMAQKLGLREWDRYHRNMAIWSYFKGGKRYTGSLEGNIFSVAFDDGWIWIIPLKGDIYSIGVVTGVENNSRIRDIGAERFYQERLAMCPLATEITASAERCDDIHLLRDWSYQAARLSIGNVFLCGDSACFIDPLFSQGVHLATYSAMLAAAAIDYLYDHPADASEVHDWYAHSYRQVYNRYHKFVSAFYAAYENTTPEFWSKRKIDDVTDQRFADKEWFSTLTGHHLESGADGLKALEEQTAALVALWEHSSTNIRRDDDQTDLAVRRLRWVHELVKNFRSLSTICWTSSEVRLVPSFRVHPTSFKLERLFVIGDDTGRVMRGFAVTERHRELFESLREHPLGYSDLAGRLEQLGTESNPVQLVGRLLDEGFLQGFNKQGDPVTVRMPLRFGGVGSDDDIS